DNLRHHRGVGRGAAEHLAAWLIGGAAIETGARRAFEAPIVSVVRVVGDRDHRRAATAQPAEPAPVTRTSKGSWLIALSYPSRLVAGPERRVFRRAWVLASSTVRPSAASTTP